MKEKMTTRKIKLFPAPHVELRIHVSDEMVKDYRECAAQAEVIGQEKNCNTCSWNNIEFGNLCMCQLNEMELLK